MLENKKIIIGITGSIAAYKSIILLRLLKREGADVQVIFSDSANNFVTQLTFSTLSEKKVLTDFFEDDDKVEWVNHVELASTNPEGRNDTSNILPCMLIKQVNARYFT